MGINFCKLILDAAKGVSEFIDKTSKNITNAIDQTGDGELDISDIQVVSERIQSDIAAAQRKADLERLTPLFPDDFEQAEFVMPKMIRVDAIDKPHAENVVSEAQNEARRILEYEIEF